MNIALELGRRVGIGAALIALASLILLISDPKRRRAAAVDGEPHKVALVIYASIAVLEDGQQGLIDGLAEQGFVEGRNITLARFNAVQLSGMHQALVHENERSGAAWTLEWLILPQMLLATGAATRLAGELLGSIETIGEGVG